MLGVEEWRKRLALKLLGKGKISFNKAAEIAQLSLWEFADLVKDRPVEWVSFDPGELELSDRFSKRKRD